MLCHVAREAESTGELTHSTLRLCRIWQHLNRRDAVNAVVRYVIVFIVVTDEIVPTVVRNKLIRIDDVRNTALRMQLEVRPLGVVGKPHLAFFLDGIVEYVEGDHHLLVVRMCEFGQIRDVRHLRMKVAIAE